MKISLTILFCFWVSLFFGQSDYVLTTYTSPYQDLTGATLVDVNDVDDDSWDDPEFVFPLGFDFEIGGQTFSSANQIGGGAIITFITSLTDPVQFFGVINDIADGDIIPGASSSTISYLTEGEPGSRIAKLQYANVAFAEEIGGYDGADSSANNRMNFQLWFYETSNMMEIHFGTSNIPDPASAFFGDTGPSIAIANNLVLAENSFDFAAVIVGNPAAPYLLSLDSIEDGSEVLTGMPVDGTVYRLGFGTDGIAEHNLSSYTLYPTLAASELTISGGLPANTTYRIIDITGKEIQSGAITGKGKIDISGLRAGFYLFSIDGLAKTKKFVKQ